MSVEQLVADLCQEARQAARALAVAPSGVKDQALLTLADALEANAPAIQEVNAKDLAAGREEGMSAAVLDRLTVPDKVIPS
ncbi:MAG: gamma-glutamyl-phosphate reductase, partial [Desulfarculaceae bacterium]|nr:gamma-glutamyl-phosphate reductase [Desulfarculaceae bacterium]